MRKAIALAALIAGALGSTPVGAEYLIDIKSDLEGSKFYVVKKEGPPEYPTLVVKRARASGGINYTKRIFDCKARTFQRLGSGPTLKEMEEDRHSADPEPAEENTIGGQLWRHACYGK
jgi:hypothetical protein